MGTPLLDVFRPALWLGARTYFRMRFEGVPHIPPSGPLIIVPNHVTYADPVLVSIPVRRPVYYMAWNVLFGVPGLAWLIRRLRAMPEVTRCVRCQDRVERTRQFERVGGGFGPDDPEDE